MRYIILVKANKDSEAGKMPGSSLISEMAAYHEALAKAGVLREVSGLQSSAKGWRIQYTGKANTLVDGPFTEAKELVASYTVIEVDSKTEALEWTRRFPNPAIDGKAGEIEVRQMFDLDDFEAGEGVERFRRMEAVNDTSQTQPVPPGMHTVTPHLVCAGAAEAIEFYKKAFDAVEEMRIPGPGGKLAHAQIRIGDSVVMLTDEFAEWESFGPKTLKGSPVTVHLYVDHVDAFFARAVEAGAAIRMPLEDTFWGDRYGVLIDPFGHSWSVATHIRDVSPDELNQKAKEMFIGSARTSTA